MNPNFLLDFGHQTVSRRVADQVIANWLRDHHSDRCHLTTTSQGKAEGGIATSFTASITDEMGTIMLQGEAGTEHGAISILATKIAAIQIPVTDLAIILDWIANAPGNADVFIHRPDATARFWRGIIGVGDDGTDIQSSCEDTITIALQDLAQELLTFQDEGIEPATGETA